MRSAIGGSGVDHLVSYLPPADVIGRDYLLAPVTSRTTGDLLRIVGKLRGIVHVRHYNR